MKKIYIALAVLAAATLVSCVKEVEDNNGSLTPVGKNTLVFRVNNGAATRAGEEKAVVSRGVTIPLGSVVDGPSFYLEETVSNMDASAPITRGTPAYTENIGVLYKNNLAIYSPDGTFGTATMETMDSDQIESGGWRYQHLYSSDPWPAGTAHFYLNMPADPTGVTITSRANEAFTFSYTSPATAAEQQDILFAYTELTKAEHNGYLPNGAPILFNHALTGVKFAIGNDTDEISYNPEDKKLAITEISFVGLKDKGTCVITPLATGTHVSAGAAEWSALETVSDTLSSGTYADTVLFQKGGSFEANGKYPDSFAAAGNERNLNDTDATQTFWLIPQAMTSDVKLTIKYNYAGTENKWTIDLGSVLAEAGVKWEAGQIRTYTIRINDVNVMIEDDVTIAGSANDGFVGSYKDKITITNTGNTRAFIRAAIVGQWLDAEGNPVFGFTDRIDELYVVESWYEDQFGPSGNHSHGEFSGLAGYTDAVNNPDGANPFNDWTLCEDGYYYYTKVVEPGDSTEDPLFDKYTIKMRPEAQMAGQSQIRRDMYFSLEIATQAISAISSITGTPYKDAEWADAWENASGVKPVKK